MPQGEAYDEDEFEVVVNLQEMDVSEFLLSQRTGTPALAVS